MKRFSSLSLFLALALVVFALGCFAGGNYYKSLLLVEQADRAKEKESRLRQIVDVQVDAQKHLLAQALHTNQLMLELDESKNQLAKEKKDFNRRLQHAANDARITCSGLPDGWVRLYNEGLYGPHYQYGKQSAFSSAGLASETGTTESGVQSGEPLNPLATPEDVLAHVRDYGQYCRELETRFLTQKQLVEGVHE